MQFKHLSLLVAAAIPLAAASPTPAIGNYYFMGEYDMNDTLQPEYRDACAHGSGHVADETNGNQAEKRAVGDYYYMGMLLSPPYVEHTFIFSCSRREHPSRETCRRRLLLHGYAVKQIALRYTAHADLLPFS